MSFVYNYEFQVVSASINNRINFISGSSGDTGSLLLTASFSNPNLTFTKGDGSTFSINLSTLVPTSASYAVSSSFAANGGGGGETVERRHDFESPYDYCGVAPAGTLESIPNWTITRLTINPNGTTITQTAVGAWTNRTELIYS
jgi:hypothetical protein